MSTAPELRNLASKKSAPVPGRTTDPATRIRPSNWIVMDPMEPPAPITVVTTPLTPKVRSGAPVVVRRAKARDRLMAELLLEAEVNPATTILPSLWIATAAAVLKLLNPVSTRPVPLPNVLSSVPSLLKRARAK